MHIWLMILIQLFMWQTYNEFGYKKDEKKHLDSLEKKIINQKFKQIKNFVIFFFR